MAPVSVASFPYSPGSNPYQQLFTDSIENAGVRVTRIPPSKWFPLHKATSSDCELLHLDWPHDWYNGKNRATRILKTWMYLNGLKLLKKKITVWTAHNLVAHDTTEADRDAKMIQALVNECRGIMVMSEAARSLLHETYKVPESVSVKTIYHGHYIDSYPNTTSRQEARAKLKISDNRFVYLIPGSIKRYKGHREAIEAFSTCSTSEDLLMIAGTGNEELIDELKEFARKSKRKDGGTVTILDTFIQDDMLQYFFNAADVTVLPFRHILNSGSLLLAMSFGSPVVAPQLGSIPEVAMPEYYFGYPGTAGIAGLTSAIEAAKNRLHGAVKQIAGAREEVLSFTRERYSWRQFGSELAAWYSELSESQFGNP